MHRTIYTHGGPIDGSTSFWHIFYWKNAEIFGLHQNNLSYFDLLYILVMTCSFERTHIVMKTLLYIVLHTMRTDPRLGARKRQVYGKQTYCGLL